MIPDVFNPATVEHVRDHAYAGIVRWPETVQRRGQFPALWFWPANRDLYLKAVAEHEAMRAIAETFLSTFHVRWLVNQIYFREPGDTDQFAWHQDVIFRSPREDFANIADGYLQTVIVIDEITKHNAPIEYILGSHKHGERSDLVPFGAPEDKLRVFERNEWRGEKILAKPGDVICWHPLTIHGSEPNTGNTPRMLYMNGFAREDAIVNKDRFIKYANRNSASQT